MRVLLQNTRRIHGPWSPQTLAWLEPRPVDGGALLQEAVPRAVVGDGTRAVHRRPHRAPGKGEKVLLLGDALRWLVR